MSRMNVVRDGDDYDQVLITNHRLRELLALEKRAEQVEATVAALRQQKADIEQQAQTAYRIFKEEVAALRAALEQLHREAESYVNLSRSRGVDLRPEAADKVRNAMAASRIALASAQPPQAEEPAEIVPVLNDEVLSASWGFAH